MLHYSAADRICELSYDGDDLKFSIILEDLTIYPWDALADAAEMRANAKHIIAYNAACQFKVKHGRAIITILHYGRGGGGIQKTSLPAIECAAAFRSLAARKKELLCGC